MGIRKIRGQVYLPGPLRAMGGFDCKSLEIETAELGDDTVTADKLKEFLSAELTGTGAEQSIAHGLGAVPSKVFAFITGTPATYAACTITEGTHDATNIKITVTSGYKFRVFALA